MSDTERERLRQEIQGWLPFGSRILTEFEALVRADEQALATLDEQAWRQFYDDGMSPADAWAEEMSNA